MGWGSYQEDNLEAKGDPVKVGKKEVPAMTIEELDDFEEFDSETEVKNTVIIKADGLAINSTEIERLSPSTLRFYGMTMEQLRTADRPHCNRTKRQMTLVKKCF